MATWLISGVLLVIVGAIVRKMIKDKKAGKGCCSCGGNCSGCPGNCHQ